MAEYVNGINPEILKWAREHLGFSEQEAAKTLNKNASFITKCESGDCALTYIQLETLADKYKRPVAIFFFPEPPDEPDIAKDLALRSSDLKKLKPTTLYLFRQAYSRQYSLMELNHETNPSEKKIFRDLHIQLRDSPFKLAKQTRTYLNIDIDEQKAWKNPTVALENWRECIEANGIFIFKDAFKDDSVDGFCLVHEEFPVVYLNNSKHPVRQIFSLFHELAHLLLGRNGITSGINPPRGKIETFCNQFAAEFLVPPEDFEEYLKYTDYNDDTIENLASKYNVSRPVILLKFVNKGILTYENYLKKVKGWEALYELHQEEESDDDSQRGNFYNTRAVYLGYRYMELVFEKYHQGNCSIEELADHLDVKVSNLAGLENRLLRKAVS